MPILQLASSKISAELMGRLKKFTELSGVNQSAAIRQAIEQFLGNVESTGFTSLTHREFKPSELAARVDAVDARLTEIDARLLELERSPEPPPSSPKPPPPSSPKPPPPLTKPLADGGQWLLTSQAWSLAQSRGYLRRYAAFSQSANAHPDSLGVWGLRFLGSSKPGDRRKASFEDLLWAE